MKRLWLLILPLLLLGCSPERPTLHIYSWANFFKQDLLDEFEKRHNCHIVIDTYDSNESLFAKLRLGATGYDLILPSNYYVELMRDLDMLEPIQAAAVTNRSTIDPAIDAILDPALSLYGVPYMITYTGIGWRNDRLQIEDPSWNIFARQDLKSRMTMLNDPRETIAAALLYHGYDINSVHPVELEQAKNTVIAWKANLAKFENEQYKNGLASGEYLLVHGYSGDIVQAMNEDDHISFISPKEGFIAAVDFLSIPKNAPNQPLAYAFINFLLEEKPALENTLFTGLLVPIPHIYPHLSKIMKKTYKPFLHADTVKQMRLIKYLGEDTHIYNDLWDDIKAS